MPRGQYDIGGTSYSQFMAEKQRLYKAAMLKAEKANYDNNGNPTKSEAVYYREAASICAEIINKNLGQRAVYDQWTSRKNDCEAEVRRIVDALSPVPVVPQGGMDDSLNSAGHSNSDFMSDHTVKYGDKVFTAGGPERTPSSGAGKTAKTGKPDANGVTTTASGFTTKNATKEIPAETIEGWYQDTPTHDFSDITGMTEVKERLSHIAEQMEFKEIREQLGMSPIKSILFYGPSGCGKTFIIEAFAAELMKKGFKFIRLLGGDIHAAYVGVAEKTVETAFREAIDNEPCIIFIDELEGVCVNRNNPKAESHEKRLTVAFLEAYNLLKEKASNQPIIFMGATNFPDQIDGAMLDRIELVAIPLPDEDAREDYFRRKLEGRLYLADDLTYSDMAQETDNYSYRDQERLIENIQEDYINRTIEFAQTDSAGKDALASGIIRMDQDSFNELKKKYIVSDKTEIRKALEAFEKRAAE